MDVLIEKPFIAELQDSPLICCFCACVRMRGCLGLCVCVCCSKGENAKHSLSYLMSGDGAKECCSVHRRYSHGLSTCWQRSVTCLAAMCVSQECILVSECGEKRARPTESLIVCFEGMGAGFREAYGTCTSTAPAFVLVFLLCIGGRESAQQSVEPVN